MRIVDRRFLAALLVLWLVLAVGLAAQAAAPNADATIETSCSTCVVGESMTIFGEGLSVQHPDDELRYYVEFVPGGYARVTVAPDGSYSLTFIVAEHQVGTQELVLTWFKKGSGRQIVPLASTTVEIVLGP